MAIYIKDMMPDIPALTQYFQFLNKYEITSVPDIDAFLKDRVVNKYEITSVPDIDAFLKDRVDASYLSEAGTASQG